MSIIREKIREIVNSNPVLQRINRFRLEQKTKALQNEVASIENSPEKKETFIKKHQKKYILIVEQTNRELQKLKGISIDTETRNDIMFCAIGYGFLPIEYLSYGLKSKNYAERRSFISDRDSMDIVHLCNDNPDIKIYSDKARTYELFSQFFGRNAICIQSEKDKEKFLSFISGQKVIVKKNVGEAMGRSVQLIKVPHETSDALDLFYELIHSNQKLLIEERIIQDEKMAKLNASSVNTIRIITFNTKEGVIAPYCFLKIGRNGSFVDNGGAGGILVGVDINTGITNTDGRDEYGKLYKRHPDTNITLQGIQLPVFDQAIALAKHLSAMTPRVKYIGWDFAYIPKGWIVVEGNEASQLIGPQLTMQRGIRTEIESILNSID